MNPIKRTEFVDVGTKHTLHTELIGNPDAQHVVFLHGGPGLGFSDRDKQFFDFDKALVLFFDQRGCGKSVPSGELEENTTEDLIQDLATLIAHYKLKDVLLFGGSWGSTLALLFAIRFPKMVKGLILRGLFMASKEERAYFEKGELKHEFPKAWRRLKSNVNTSQDDEVMEAFVDKILTDKNVREELSFEMSLYAFSVNTPQRMEAELIELLNNSNHLTRSVILSHFSKHDFFIEDGQIEEHIGQLKDIPITIVHGSNDHITRLQFASRIANAHANIELIETQDGHSPYDRENFEALKGQLAKFT